jgi:hypothetical protein
MMKFAVGVYILLIEEALLCRLLSGPAQDAMLAPVKLTCQSRRRGGFLALEIYNWG